ncbi:MAG: hypothetical protein JXQ71_00745 [Verrucomicrobia bacterium]|nr:hypothetical protein [Verrucomicrobiota bacterium]
MTMLTRRTFLSTSAAAAAGAWTLMGSRHAPAAQAAADEEVLERIRAQQPSRLATLPADFNARVGATHVAGKYHLTQKPFLLEGAERLLAMGTRLGKFWFMPRHPGNDYPFNSRWGHYSNLADLARAEYFQAVFAMPFRTILLEAHTPTEDGWRDGIRSAAFYDRITVEFEQLTAHLYQTYRHRDVTFVLQHWEGDWLLRGRGGALWNPPPDDWKKRCDAMIRWLEARQKGVSRARAAHAAGARCVVAHAAEVNRVADLWSRIPTMTEHVLPHVELDLVSYSSYDGMKNPLTLWRCLQEIRSRARTGPLFGNQALCVGEMGIPENDAPRRITERWDEFMGVMLAAGVKYIVHWELYCNELNPKIQPPPKPPVKDPSHLRGFWLVKPDGTLSESGKYFAGLWRRGA